MQEKETSSFASAPAEIDEITGDGTETERSIDVKLTSTRTVKVTFDLGEITPRVRKSLANLTEADEDKAEGAMIDLLERIVIKWDYVTKKGKSVAANADEISEHVSLRDLSAIVSGVFAGSQSPNE